MLGPFLSGGSVQGCVLFKRAFSLIIVMEVLVLEGSGTDSCKAPYRILIANGDITKRTLKPNIEMWKMWLKNPLHAIKSYNVESRMKSTIEGTLSWSADWHTGGVPGRGRGRSSLQSVSKAQGIDLPNWPLSVWINALLNAVIVRLDVACAALQPVPSSLSARCRWGQQNNGDEPTHAYDKACPSHGRAFNSCHLLWMLKGRGGVHKCTHLSIQWPTHTHTHTHIYICVTYTHSQSLNQCNQFSHARKHTVASSPWKENKTPHYTNT